MRFLSLFNIEIDVDAIRKDARQLAIILIAGGMLEKLFTDTGNKTTTIILISSCAIIMLIAYLRRKKYE